MEDAGQELFDGLKRCFAGLEDPRVVGRCDHRLLDVVTIALLAVLSGAEDWPDIELFGEARQDWLRTFLELPNGIPSHDTFRRVFGALERNQFAQALFQWTQTLAKALGDKLISIDGKALRRSFAKKSGKAMLHLVTAWASENGLTLGQVACEEKSNEITAIPELLKLLAIKGCTVTIDAMGCQTEIASQIREQKGHYVLALKGNQSGLQEDMQRLFEEAIDSDFAGLAHEVHQSRETGHGRTDERTCHVIGILRDHPQRAKWQDLSTLAAVTSRRVVGDKETWETRLYVSSHLPRATLLATAIRRHWSIENSQHWVLDVVFGEDSRRQQDRNGAANLAAVRRLAISLLRQEKTNTRGAKNKRLRCALDPSYLLKVVNTANF